MIAGLLLALGVIQVASDGFVREPGTLSAHVPRAFSVRVYRALDRVAPAPYVEETLAEDALAHDDPAHAMRYAIRIPAGPRRNEILGRIADAQHLPQLAMEYYFAAPDLNRMQEAITALASRGGANARAAYDLEMRFIARLAALRTHPDAVAEGYWRAGEIAESYRDRAASIRDYQTAVLLAPLNVKYLLGAANEALVAGRRNLARRDYERGATANPSCGDCYAGLGLLALERGDRGGARAYAARARSVQPGSAMLRTLSDKLR